MAPQSRKMCVETKNLHLTDYTWINTSSINHLPRHLRSTCLQERTNVQIYLDFLMLHTTRQYKCKYIKCSFITSDSRNYCIKQWYKCKSSRPCLLKNHSKIWFHCYPYDFTVLTQNKDIQKSVSLISPNEDYSK